MTLHRTAFNINVHFGDDNMAKAIGMGSIVVGVKTEAKTTMIRIINVFHVSILQANLLSVSKFLSKGLKV